MRNEAIKEALKAALREHRLPLLAKGSMLVSLFDLKNWCAKVGASSSEFDALILHRAAIAGFRPPNENILRSRKTS